MRRFALVFACCTSLLWSGPAFSGEKYALRATGSYGARIVNEVGLWKTAAAARSAKQSLAQHPFAELVKFQACEFRPGTSAKILRRECDVSFVRGTTGMFSGCEGYVRNDFLVKK